MNMTSNNDAVRMTSQAIDHVAGMLRKRGHGIGLHLGVKTMGCSGYAYSVNFLDEIERDDMVFDISNDIKVAVDADSFELIKGTVIDYSDEGLNRQFWFINPNVIDTCGCGESFSIKPRDRNSVITGA